MNYSNSPQSQNIDIKSEISMRRLVINTILIILFAIAAFVVFGLAVDVARNVMIVLSLVLVGVLAIAIFGNPLPGQIVAPFGVMLAMIYTAYTGDGLHDEILIGSPLVIVLAGLLLGNRGAILFSILLAAGISGIGLIEMNGTEFSLASTLTNVDDIVAVVVSMIAIALVLNLLISRLNTSLAEARRNEDAQAPANRELRILQTDLEKRVNERTLQLNRRAIQLQASSEVGRAISSLGDLDELLKSVTTLISER